MRNARGFTLIELMIVVVIVGLLAAVAIPNFIAMQDRAKEASTKANMHVFQLATEGWYIDSGGLYPAKASNIATHEGLSFANPFTHQAGSGKAWENRPGDMNAAPSVKPGIVSYAQGTGLNSGDYNIKGQGKSAPLALVLTNPQ